MGSQRRAFIRTLGISAFGLPIASNLAFGANTFQLRNSNKKTSILKHIEREGFKLLHNASYKLNANCKAIPVVKENFLWSNEKGLLVVMDNDTAFLLSEKQAETYKTFISEYRDSYAEHKSLSKTQLQEFTTPTRILKTNATNDFRFKNATGKILEVKAFKSKTCVKIVA